MLFISHEQVTELVLDTTKQSYCIYPFVTEKLRETLRADLVL